MSSSTDALVRRSERLRTDDLDLGAFARHPLDPATLRCLRYMHDVEGHTACYLRDLLATRAHRDPEITAFLACWGYEEHWHGEALADVLRAHGQDGGPDRLRLVRARLGRFDALRPAAFTALSALSRHLVAVHMTWGAVNEWTTQAAYARLLDTADHPVLGELLRRIMRQEGRHIDFYVGQARRRLTESAAARRLTRAALARWWAPVGSGVMPAREVAFLARHLFGDDEGRAAARRIDRNVDRLPGQGGLHLVERAARAGAGAQTPDAGPTSTARPSGPERSTDPERPTTTEREYSHAC
ncbi:MAG TPA: ferritin-like domain-containing protein [Acidimicrobiales bacterium]|nr:ferritin-like domain-containing protein [Acidimicrobiales bacterium]